MTIPQAGQTESRQHPFRWAGEDVTVHQGPLPKIAQLVPIFERRRFVLAPAPSGQAGLFEPPPPGGTTAENKRFDVIVRVPSARYREDLPIGIVSKAYALVQHQEIIAAASEALGTLGIDQQLVHADLALSEHASKMSLKLRLPEAFNLDPGDGHPMALRLEVLNSVDGSLKLGIWVGWFRFVCSNGLVIGRSRFIARYAHGRALVRELPDLLGTMKERLLGAAQERDVCVNWVNARVSEPAVARWSDRYVAGAWGPTAAARVYLIAMTGHDGEPADRFVRIVPSRSQMVPGKRVPGSPERANNAFAVSQALSWVAGTVRDVQDQFDRIAQIPELVNLLVRKK